MLFVGNFVASHRCSCPFSAYSSSAARTLCSPIPPEILQRSKISGPEAYRIGLVHEVWPLDELKVRAISLAHELAKQPAGAVRSMLNVIVGSEEKSLDELLAAERVAVNANRGTADSKEGMMSFMQKRNPVFNQS